MDSWRSVSWSLGLGIDAVSSAEYLASVYRCDFHRRILEDSGRCLRGLRSHWCPAAAEDEAVLVRLETALLNQQTELGHYQNLPMLVFMVLTQADELEAFFILKRIIGQQTRTWWISGTPGAHAANSLARIILWSRDPELAGKLPEAPLYQYLHFINQNFFVGIKPFDQVLLVWDFLAVHGFHLVPLLAAAWLISRRDSLLEIASQEPSKLARVLLSGGVLDPSAAANSQAPLLNASKLIEVTRKILQSPEFLQDGILEVMALSARNARLAKIIQELDQRKNSSPQPENFTKTSGNLLQLKAFAGKLDLTKL